MSSSRYVSFTGAAVGLALASLGASGCSSVSYTMGSADFDLRSSESPQTLPGFSGSMTTHTVLAMDNTGVVCAAMMNMGEESEARDEALDAAMPYQSTITYSYRVHTAEEFGSGIRCGGYFRHGQGRPGFSYRPGRNLNFAEGDYTADSVSLNEAGLVIDLPNRLADGLYVMPTFIVGVGFIDILSADDDVPTRSQNFGEFDVGARASWVPGYLYGFGLHGSALFNLANLSFNLGARVAYQWAFTESFAIELGAGFDHRDQAWPSQYELRTNEFNLMSRVSLLW